MYVVMHKAATLAMTVAAMKLMRSWGREVLGWECDSRGRRFFGFTTTTQDDMEQLVKEVFASGLEGIEQVVVPPPHCRLVAAVYG